MFQARPQIPTLFSNLYSIYSHCSLQCITSTVTSKYAHLETFHHTFLQYSIEQQQAEQCKHWYSISRGSIFTSWWCVTPVVIGKKPHLFNFKPYLHFQKASIKNTSINSGNIASGVNLLLLNLWMTLQWPFSYLIFTVSLSYLYCPSTWISMPS